MSDKTAFITGASRGIGAETAIALAKAGYRVAITARTMAEGEAHDHVGSATALSGSLETTARAVEQIGSEVLTLRADILDESSMIAAANTALEHFGRIDLLLNNAVYQGTGNVEPLLTVSSEQLRAIYQGNVLTPLALVQALLPGMIDQGRGTILNMVSQSAFHDPPAAGDKGGWGFAYPSSKAAVARMAGSLRAEHPDTGLRVFNLEPGTVITEVMRMLDIDKTIESMFKPCSAAAVAAVVAWLAEHDPLAEWKTDEILHAPAIAKELDLLQSPSMLTP
ncbi:MAG: SDR family NAD(P)-dependent oxidoreductase [Halioglobus sp.]|nr:SDR family NAD(P)-dependent oxidoreductase [Halioglobus sp.]